MVARLFRDLFASGSRAERKRAAAHCDSILLLGDGRFAVDVAGTGQFQAVLRNHVGVELQPRELRDALFTMQLSRNGPKTQRRIVVSLGAQEVGYCPSHLTTRFEEWLEEWGLAHALVHCEGRIICKSKWLEEESRLIAYLDIAEPFGMTVLKFGPDERA